MSLPSEGGQNLSANQISSTYLSDGWDITTSVFKKTNVRHFVILLPVSTSDLDHFAVICMLFWISLLITEFRPHRSTDCGNMTSYLFLKMAATTAKYYFRFSICWCHCLQMAKVYQETKFRRHISIYGWDITTSVFEKQTSVILEFYFRFWSRPFRRNRRFLHHAIEFRPHRSNHCENMMPYPFLKMAATTAKFNATSGFVFVNVTAYRRSKSIRKPNFVDISQFTAEI